MRNYIYSSDSKSVYKMPEIALSLTNLQELLGSRKLKKELCKDLSVICAYGCSFPILVSNDSFPLLYCMLLLKLYVMRNLSKMEHTEVLPQSIQGGLVVRRTQRNLPMPQKAFQMF